MNKSIIKYKEIFLAVMYLAVIFLLIYFAVIPQAKKISEKKDSMQEQILLEQRKVAKIAEVPKLEKQYNEVKKNEGMFNFLLKNGGEVGLIERLEALASSTGNEIKIDVVEKTETKASSWRQQTQQPQQEQSQASKTISDTIPQKEYLQLKIQLSGSYNSVVVFLKKMEMMEYFSEVISFDITKEDASKNPQIGNPFDQNVQNQEANTPVEKKISGVFDVIFYKNSN